MLKRWIITTVLMVGLAFTSFGQHGFASEEQTQAIAFILAGGDWADLCGDGTNPLAHAGKCMACVIGKHCVLPANQDLGTHRAEARASLWITSGQTAHPAQLQSGQTARAPPVI